MVRRFNDWLADRVTSGVSTMWCAYAFFALAVYGFPWGDLTPQSFVQWLSQECIQLVMLSILAVGQRNHAGQLTDLHNRHEALHDRLDSAGL